MKITHEQLNTLARLLRSRPLVHEAIRRVWIDQQTIKQVSQETGLSMASICNAIRRYRRMHANLLQMGQTMEVWNPMEDYPSSPTASIDVLWKDGSVWRGCLPQQDGDLWWGGAGRDLFIDPQCAYELNGWRFSS